MRMIFKTPLKKEKQLESGTDSKKNSGQKSQKKSEKNLHLAVFLCLLSIISIPYILPSTSFNLSEVELSEKQSTFRGRWFNPADDPYGLKKHTEPGDSYQVSDPYELRHARVFSKSGTDDASVSNPYGIEKAVKTKIIND